MAAETTKTPFIEEDNNLGEVLDHLYLGEKNRIVSKFGWIETGDGNYVYFLDKVPEEMIVDMLENGYKDHFWYVDTDGSFQPLTQKILDSKDVTSIYRTKFLISGIYVASHEARNFILKKLLATITEIK